MVASIDILGPTSEFLFDPQECVCKIPNENIQPNIQSDT